MGMIAVVAHHVSRFGETRACLLGLKRVTGAHSGHNMACLIIPVIKYYEFQDRLGYFVLDSISSNDTCVREVLKNLRPDLDEKQHRLRCFGHVINLAAKAFLFGKEPEAYETNSYSLPEQEEKDLNN
jgi:hypothetical protein